MQPKGRIKRQRPQIEINPESLDFVRWAHFEITRNGHVSFRLGGSNMEPTIKYREMVTVAPIDVTTLQPGDIVLHCTPRDTAVVQRVVRFIYTPEGKFVITRGDNCLLENAPVPVEYVIGQIIAVERDGEQISLINPER